MSISFKFDDLVFTSHMSVADVKVHGRVFLIQDTYLWFELYQCNTPTPTVMFEVGNGLDGRLSLNGHRLFNLFRHAFKEFVMAVHKWAVAEFGFKGLPTCKLHPGNDLSVIGLKTRRYVNDNELVLEWFDDVASVGDCAFGTSADVHGCDSCNLRCKTPVGSVCALPTFSNVAEVVQQDGNANWLSSVSHPSDTTLTYQLTPDDGQKSPSWCKLSRNNEEAKRQQSRITVMQDKHGRPIPLLKMPYGSKSNSLVSLAGLEPLARMTPLTRTEDILLYDVISAYIPLRDMLKGASCESVTFIEWISENSLDLLCSVNS